MEAFFREVRFECHLREYYWCGAFHKKPEIDRWPLFPWIKKLERKASQEIEVLGCLEGDSVIEIFRWGTGRRHGPLLKAKEAEKNNPGFWCRQTKAAAEALTAFPYKCRLGDREKIEGWISRVYLALAMAPSEATVKGIGLTYYSKILRFMCPEKFGACDVGMIGSLFKEGLKDASGNTFSLSFLRGNRESEAKKYALFCWVLQTAAEYLNRNERLLPTGQGTVPEKWRAADVEMAFFGLATSRKPRQNCEI
jgi:hypothetical protein